MWTAAPWRTLAIGVTDRYIPRLIVIIACILACCYCSARHDATDHYRDAVQAFRDARFAQALAEARDIARTCPPDTECHWTARLLEAQVLLSDKQVDAAALALTE